jgi:glycine dehydrogenase
MLAIRNEIKEVEEGMADRSDNVLKNAPHTSRVLLVQDWTRSYTREKAAYPLSYLRFNKFWPSVSRVDNAYGDRNLICSCIPVEEYIEEVYTFVRSFFVNNGNT